MTATMAMMAKTGTAAMIATTVTMMPNGNDDYKNQAATTARVTTTVARAMGTGENRATATMVTTATTAMMSTTATMATMVTMTPNSDDAASGGEGKNENTKR
jgi:hypothetical protein